MSSKPLLPASPQTPLVLLAVDLMCAVFSGASIPQLLARERRRRRRHEAARLHYARCMEDFPELTGAADDSSASFSRYQRG